MIFWSDIKREIGSVYTPKRMVDSFNNYIEPQPCLCVREATHEEWEADVRKNGGSPRGFGPFPYYYEVHTD